MFIFLVSVENTLKLKELSQILKKHLEKNLKKNKKKAS